MNILIMSDLHFEFHRDGGRGFIAELGSDSVDVLVLAGDIDSAEHLPETLSLLCAKYPQVIMALGNHEFYGHTPEDLDRFIENCPANLHWLERDTVTLDGVRFVGTTLWFPKPPSWAPKKSYNDFNWIQEFEPWVYEQNEAAVEFLNKTLQADDVLVTHFLPLQESIALEHEGSLLNCFFWAGELADRVVRERGPRLVIHGHTHVCVQRSVGRTEVVCNPLGYPHENTGFDPRLIVSVS